MDESNVVRTVRGSGLVGSRCVLTVSTDGGFVRDVELIRSSMLRLQTMEKFFEVLAQHEDLLKSIESSELLKISLLASFAQISQRIKLMEKEQIAVQAESQDRISNMKARIQGASQPAVGFVAI